MKVTSLNPGDLVASAAGNSVIEIESEDNGKVLFRVHAPGGTIHRFFCDARDLIDWKLVTKSHRPDAPEKREAFEDLAVTIQGSPTSVSDSLNAYFASGWSFVDLTYYPQGVYLVVLRRRAVGAQTPKAGG